MKDVLFVLTASFVLTGCTNNLTRSEASSKIEKTFPKVLSYQVFMADLDHATNLREVGIIHAGLVTVDTAKPLLYQRIFFTDKASQFLVETPKDEKELRLIQRVKVGELKLKEITGVTISNNKAVVTYTQEVASFTPFAKLAKNMPKLGEITTAEAKFTKYDDGWRLDDPAQKVFLVK